MIYGTIKNWESFKAPPPLPWPVPRSVRWTYNVVMWLLVYAFALFSSVVKVFIALTILRWLGITFTMHVQW